MARIDGIEQGANEVQTAFERVAIAGTAGRGHLYLEPMAEPENGAVGRVYLGTDGVLHVHDGDVWTDPTMTSAIDADWYSTLQGAIDASAGRTTPLPVVIRTARTESTGISVPSGLRTKLDLRFSGAASPVTYTGAGAFFTLDPSATPATATRRSFWRLRDLYLVGPGSGTAGSIGLHLNNGISGTVENVLISGFETGVKCDGEDLASGAAFYYNNFFNVAAISSGTAWHFTGQANSNKVFGGRAALSTTGVLIDYLCSDVGFFGTDIEGNSGTGAIINGHGNQFMGCRFENSSATYEVHFNQAANADSVSGERNIVFSYIESDITTRVNDASPNQTNLYQGIGNIHPSLMKLYGVEMTEGHLNLGDNALNTSNNVIAATRSAAASGKPMIDLGDTYSTSGSPIGLRYRPRRYGAKGIVIERDNGDTTYTHVFTAETDSSSGKGRLLIGALGDTNLYRDNTDRLATDDYFRTGAVASLPTASSAYRGYTIRVEGGAGVADALYICVKDAADAYSWKTVTVS